MAFEYDSLPFDSVRLDRGEYKMFIMNCDLLINLFCSLFADFDIGDEEDENLYEAIEVLLAEEDDESHNSGATSMLASSAGSVDKGKATKKRSPSNRQPKKRKLNPDAATIASCTEAALKDLEVDPGSEDAKKMRRQIRNRLSAQFHRDRKNMYIKTLEDRVAEKDKEIESLKAEVNQLKQDNLRLKTLHCSPLLSDYQGHTDSDSSATHTPVHEPTNLVSTYPLPMTSYISSPAGPLYPSIMSAPLFKSLSVLSVICLLCFTGLAPHGVLIGDGSRVITKESVIDSGIFDELFPISDGNRRLFAVEDLHRPLNQDLSSKLMVPVNVSLLDETVVVQPKYNLRRVLENNLSYNSSIALPAVGDGNLKFGKSIFVSKDLIHFDSSHNHGYRQNWFADHKRDSLSYSHIVMSKGVALFDPSLQMSESPLALHSRGGQFPVIRPPSGAKNVETSILSHHHQLGLATLPFQQTGLIAAPDRNVPMDLEDDASENHDDNKRLVSTSNWPIVPSIQSNMDIRSSLPGSTMSPSCELEKQAILNQLLSKSNLVTVTLPASSVRMGKSLSDSKDSTVESIMQLFNLTALGGDDSVGSSLGSNTTADASIEINCILVGAKMVINSSSK